MCERVKSDDKMTAGATGVNLRSAPWESVVDLISRGKY